MRGSTGGSRGSERPLVGPRWRGGQGKPRGGAPNVPGRFERRSLAARGYPPPGGLGGGTLTAPCCRVAGGWPGARPRRKRPGPRAGGAGNGPKGATPVGLSLCSYKARRSGFGAGTAPRVAGSRPGPAWVRGRRGAEGLPVVGRAEGAAGAVRQRAVWGSRADTAPLSLLLPPLLRSRASAGAGRSEGGRTDRQPTWERGGPRPGAGCVAALGGPGGASAPWSGRVGAGARESRGAEPRTSLAALSAGR